LLSDNYLLNLDAWRFGAIGLYQKLLG